MSHCKGSVQKEIFNECIHFPLVLWGSFRISYLHVVLQAFSRSKKIETTWWFLISPLQMYVSSLISWSLVLWFCQNPFWYLDKMLCFSRYQISCALTILAIILQMQLVNTMEHFVGLKWSFLDLDIDNNFKIVLRETVWPSYVNENLLRNSGRCFRNW